MSVLQLCDVGFRYTEEKLTVFEHLNFTFEEGRIYAIVGKSGAGKTTLLSLLSGLAAPTCGKILYEGRDIAKTDTYRYRSRDVGVVFQSFNLLTHLTAAENVILSMDIAGMKFKGHKAKQAYADALLQKVELDEAESARRVLKLSGGQQQRVAIARALSYNPHILLADEPTGNLDEETQEEIMAIFRRLADEGKCIILVTHSPYVAGCADVKYELVRPPHPKKAKPVPLQKPPAADFGTKTLGLN